MAKGKWFKEGAECWVYSTFGHWVEHGKIIKIGHTMTYVLLDWNKCLIRQGCTEESASTPFYTDSEIFYSLGMIRKRYGNDFKVRE